MSSVELRRIHLGRDERAGHEQPALTTRRIGDAHEFVRNSNGRDREPPAIIVDGDEIHPVERADGMEQILHTHAGPFVKVTKAGGIAGFYGVEHGFRVPQHGLLLFRDLLPELLGEGEG